jgi:hypothetical protein
LLIVLHALLLEDGHGRGHLLRFLLTDRDLVVL